jgi:hypothetical protein
MTTKSTIRVFLWVGIALFLGTWAFAQTPITLTAPSPGPSYDGIYVSPYYATVGGVANTPIVCDDCGDDTTIGDQWHGTITAFSGLTAPAGTSWDLAGKGSLATYDAVAWLTTQVLAQPSGSVNQIIYTFADWAVFDAAGVEKYLNSNPITSGPLTTATLCTDIFGSYGCGWTSADPLGGDLLQAFTASVPSGGYSLEVISPDTPGTSSVCPAETGCPAQEFIAVVPEGGAAVAYLLLAGVCCFGAIRMRFRRQMGSVSVA